MLPKSLIGTPDEYQDYFVFNKFGNLNVAYWLVEINEVIVNEDSTRQNQLKEIVRVTDRNFLKLDEKYVNIPLFVEVKGFTNTGTLVAQDEWEWQPIPHGLPWWGGVCRVRCNAPTYSYVFSVLGEYHYNTTNLTGQNGHHVAGGDHTLHAGNFGNSPLVSFRNFSNEQKSGFCANGSTPLWNNPDNKYDNIFSPRHHGMNWCPDALLGGQWSGVNVGFVPGSLNNGLTYKDYLGHNIPANENVWQVAKAWGKWGEFKNELEQGTFLTTSNGLADLPATPCGQIPQNGLINGALLFTYNNMFDNILQKEVNNVMVNVPLECAQMAPGGPVGSGPGHWTGALSQEAFNKLVSKYGTKPIGGGFTGTLPLFEILEDFQDIYINDMGGTNSSNVSWWPGDDFHLVQIYKLDQDPNNIMTEPVSLSLESIIDSEGNLISQNYTLAKGLYNLVLMDANQDAVKFIFELEHNAQLIINKSDLAVISIYPNPFDANQQTITSKIESSVNSRYTYTVVDLNNNEFYRSSGFVRSGDLHEIKLRTQNLPSGQLFHKFVFDDGSVKILQTLKN